MARIVLLTYGDRRALAGAMDRVRRYGAPVHLVAASPRATMGLRRHRSQLVEVHEELGRAGLLAALAGAGSDEPVLLLHDDVLLSPEAARVMLEAAVGRAVVVPTSNNPDADGYVPELPADVVPPLGPPLPPVPAERFRTACWAATASRVHGLAAHRLTGARTRIQLPDGTVSLLPHVIATHLDDCRDQLELPESPDERPLLVASMIVRDEERFLPDCLASLEGLVDRVDICDTGSTDRTIEIALASGANVIERPWVDDFSIARNHALEMSHDAHWVLQIDADERARFDDADAFRSFLATAIDEPGAFYVRLRDIAGNGEVVSETPLPRIFPGAGTMYVGRLHEVAHSADGTFLTWSVLSGLSLDHLGYQDAIIQARGKRSRNLALARSAHESSPTPGNALQLARTIPGQADVDERVALLEPLAALIRDDSIGMNETAHQYYYDIYSRALSLAGRPDEAWAVISDGRKRYPHNTVLSATFAEIGVHVGHFEDVLEAESAEVAAAPLQVVRPDLVASRSLEVAKSRLAVGDNDGAAAEVEELLQRGVPSRFNRWVEAVSVLVLAAPDRAVEVLHDVAARDRTGDCLRAIGQTFDANDAAEFAVKVCVAVDDSSREQRLACLSLTLSADDPVQTELALGLLPDLTDRDLRVAATDAGPGAAPLLRQRLSLPEPPAGLTVQDAVAATAHGIGDADAYAQLLAADLTGDAMRVFSEQVPAAAAAPVVMAAVELGARSPAHLRSALLVVTLGGDARQAQSLVDLVGEIASDVLSKLVSRAEARGADDVASTLSNWRPNE